MILTTENERQRLLQILNLTVNEVEFVKQDALLSLSSEKKEELVKENFVVHPSCSVCGVCIITDKLYQYSSGHLVSNDHVYTRVCRIAPEDKKPLCPNTDGRYKKEYEFPFSN